MNLFGFIIRMFHDERSRELQILLHILAHSMIFRNAVLMYQVNPQEFYSLFITIISYIFSAILLFGASLLYNVKADYEL